MPMLIPRFRDTRSPLPIRGDEFLRFTAREAQLITEAEAKQGYALHRSAPDLSRASIPDNDDALLRVLFEGQDVDQDEDGCDDEFEDDLDDEEDELEDDEDEGDDEEEGW